MLIIGRRKPREGDDFGGVVVLYELFLEYFDDNLIEYEEIDLNWRNYSNKIIFLLTIYLVIGKAVCSTKHQKISFHGTTTDFTFYAPMVVFLGKLTGKHISLRKFGGNFDQYYDALNFIQRNLVTYALNKADVVFFETQCLVKEFSWVDNSVWFPNVRKNKDPKNKLKDYQQRFVFISHIKRTKGVNIILEAIRKLSNEYVIHLYGPRQNYSPPAGLKNIFYQHYKGVLQPNDVVEKMNHYDVLLLPTFHKGEGYPGAILEAYSQGLPVISTRWRAIPEIVKEGETGYLIEPKSVRELVDVMQAISKDDYSQLSENALNFFEEFDQEKVMKRIVKHL